MNKETNFHKSRIAFLIINNEILYLKDSPMGHLEWYLSLGYPIEEFDNIVRGYLKDNKLIYYKGDFEYDEEVIKIAIQTENEIKKQWNNFNAIAYCGVVKGKVGEPWPPKVKLDDIKKEYKEDKYAR